MTSQRIRSIFPMARNWKRIQAEAAGWTIRVTCMKHMRGATPPNVYELAFREKTFHGIQALRLKPVGGGNIFGRSGLLAHTYMLGPKGESNGCVVFKNYNAFLQAFQNGQVKRLIVVDNLNRTSKVTLTVDQDLTAQRVFGCDESGAVRW